MLRKNRYGLDIHSSAARAVVKSVPLAGPQGGGPPLRSSNPHVASTILSGALCAACLFHFAMASAEPPKEAEMKNAGADEAPQRMVLDGVPKVRYFRDGMCPFALGLKCLTDFLGEDYFYGYILGASGACFRMAWNHTTWDCGNMDLGRLGPEPFRHGLRAVGLRHRFLLKKSWWPEAIGDDIELLDDKTAEAVLRARIVQSIRDGLPILAFGVVGPPEVSIICGYDDGGKTLIGWAAMDGDHPKDQREPNGMFRQRDWFARTEGVMLVEGKPERPDLESVYRDALDWAYQVSTLPKTKTHCFGQAAYAGWAGAMLKDPDFPWDDEKTLQDRRFTVWDGMIMLAERGAAAEFLEAAAEARGEAAKSQPQAAEHLREAARLFREEGKCCVEMQKLLGGHALPSKPFADPCARRRAADFIHEAREKNAAAVKRLALALGKEPPGFSFDGKELKGLRPANRAMALLGAIQGCLRYLGKDVDDAWLYGITGAAFMLNIDEKVDVSGPTSWGVAPDAPDSPKETDAGHLQRMMPYLGATMANCLVGWVEDADFAEKQKAAQAFIRKKIDAGIPCVSWDGDWTEYTTANGYTSEAVVEWTHYVDGGFRLMPWEKFGRNITQSFSITSVELAEPPGDEREAVLEALKYALSLRSTEKSPGGKSARGLAGYDLWLECLETGAWHDHPYPGVGHNASCWGECRAYAERFLRQAGEKVGGELRPQFEGAADHYGEVWKALCRIRRLPLCNHPPPPIEKSGAEEAIALVRKARDEETKGLAVIERIVDALKAGGPAINQRKARRVRMETKRLILRPFAADDWRDFQELSADWAAAPGPAFDKWPTSKEASKKSVEHMATADKYLAMCVRESGKVVGLLAINGTEKDGQLDVGHVILSKYRDDKHDREALQALIQHCFDTRDVPAVITHNADHAPQLAPLKSLGFTIKDPEDRGTLVITREEWVERHGGRDGGKAE